MGPHNACSYADLAMTTIDRRILDINNRPNNVLFPPYWSRFRDDYFSIWFESVPSLLKFNEWLNSLSNVTVLNLLSNIARSNWKFLTAYYLL